MFGSDNVSHVKMNISKIFMQTDVSGFHFFQFLSHSANLGSKTNKAHNLQVYLCSISL